VQKARSPHLIQQMQYTSFFFYGSTPPSGPGPPHYRASRPHTNIHIHRVGTLWDSDQPSASTSAWYQTTLTTHTIMSPVGFEPTIPAGERPQTHATRRPHVHWDRNIYYEMRSAPFFGYYSCNLLHVSGFKCQAAPLTLEGWTGRFPRNVGKKLPIHGASNLKRAWSRVLDSCRFGVAFRFSFWISLHIRIIHLLLY
jgi:hypothetical protein